MFTYGIIGRPNVGKSTLFNRISGKRAAITDDRPGVTRDLLEARAAWLGKSFRLIDSAGFDLTNDIFKQEMREQLYRLMDFADAFLLVTDITGLHPLDETVSKMLHERGKKFIVVVNKIDSSGRESAVADFYSLGAENVIGVSAAHSRGVDELLDLMTEGLELDAEEGEAEDITKIAVIGRPNVGKSSLINAWLGETRVIVTDIAGTTRDSVDTEFAYKGRRYLLVDTAGLRKKSVMFKDAIERVGYFRSMDAIERADVVVAVADASEGFTERDIKVIADAWEAGRGVIVALNKSDITDGEKKAKDIKEKLAFIHNPPIFFVSALTKKNIFKIFGAADKMMAEYGKRAPTARVNEALEEALARHQPPMVHARRLKFYYMTQVGVKPPHFVAFVNYPAAVHFSYRRFIVNIIREFFGFDGVPVKLSINKRS